MMRFFTLSESRNSIIFSLKIKLANCQSLPTGYYRIKAFFIRKRTLGRYIYGNYDKGGHKVSLEITIHKSDQNTYKNNTSNSFVQYVKHYGNGRTGLFYHVQSG
jgi:hypothetical protein